MSCGSARRTPSRSHGGGGSPRTGRGRGDPLSASASAVTRRCIDDYRSVAVAFPGIDSLPRDRRRGDRKTMRTRRVLLSGMLGLATVAATVMTVAVATAATNTYEAEATGNTLAGGARVASCTPCSGGKKVGWVGNNAGTLQFNGASVAAVIYQNKVVYAVVGDTGPSKIIGEGSYALAVALGIDPDPATGGADSGVTFIVLTGDASIVKPIESHAAAVTLGERLARQFIDNN